MLFRSAAPEVGLLPVRLTDAALSDPVLEGLPSELVTLQWHGDTFDLPDGAVLLAGSPAYPNQAFRFGKAYGVQFHLEVSRAMAEEWARVPEYKASLEQVLGPGSLPPLLDEFDRHAEGLLSYGRSLFERWLGATVS